MSDIRFDFKPYVDGNNLLTPGPTSGTGKGSDNGPMYTSEYFIMLKKLDLLCPADVADYDHRMGSCVTNGMLNRAPSDSDQEGPDDYYGVMNGCMELGITSYPRMFLWSLIRHVGFLNNNSPGTWTGSAFMARQPWLVCSMVSAAFPSLKNPLHWLVRALCLPLYILTAGSLLLSCINTPTDDTDARRLAWHSGNNNSKVSLLCWLAYKIWLNRLKSAYPGEMNDVAGIYYQPTGNNPYQKWWVT